MRQSGFVVWRSIFKVNQSQPLSVRALIPGLEQQKLVLFVEARGVSLLKTAKNFSEFLTQDSPGTTRTELEGLATISVSAAGKYQLQAGGGQQENALPTPRACSRT
jgi:hypothetical protein